MMELKSSKNNRFDTNYLFSKNAKKIIIIVLIIASIELQAGDVDIAGFADSYHTMRLKEDNDLLTSRTRLRTELTGFAESSIFFGSFNAEYDNLKDEETSIDIREIYGEYQSDNWDLRIGRQIIIWGKADGVQILDIISPTDMSDFLTLELDDIRIPVDAAKFRYFTSRMAVEVIWIPVFAPSELPGQGSIWSIGMPDLGSDLSLNLKDTQFPENKIENGEFAFKFSTYLSGVDLGFSVFYTWDDYAVNHYNVHNLGDSTIIDIYPKHHRLTVPGVEFAISKGEFVFRGEAAYYIGKYHASTDFFTSPPKADMLNTVLGIDWYAANNWQIITELANHTITDYNENTFSDDQYQTTAILSVSKSLLRENLTLSSSTYYDFSDKGIFQQLSAEYALSGQMHLALGTDIFEGDAGIFGNYKDNTQLWVRAKVMF